MSKEDVTIQKATIVCNTYEAGVNTHKNVLNKWSFYRYKKTSLNYILPVISKVSVTTHRNVNNNIMNI